MILTKGFRKRFMKEIEENHRRIIELSVKFFTKRDASILDIGSGDGQLIDRVASSAQIKKSRITCVEIDKVYGEKCRSLGFKTESFDVNKDFPFRDGSFDYIIANQIIEHLYFTDKFMEEINRVMKPGGILILSSTNLAGMHSRLLLLLGYMPNCLHPSQNIVGTFVKKKGLNPLYGHKSVFTGKALREFTIIHGFRILLYETQSIPLIPRGISKIICSIFDFGGHVNIVAAK